MGLSTAINRWLGRWWVCTALCAASLVFFGWVVPDGVADVTAGRTLAPKILDEYVMTWTLDDARQFYAALGAHGREAYRAFYLHLDFWFPMLTLSLAYASLLSLAFRPPSRLAWLNLTPLLMYVCDVAENVNHFLMAGSYPDLPAAALQVGPAFTYVKWLLIFVLPLPALAAWMLQWASRARRRSAVPGSGSE